MRVKSPWSSKQQAGFIISVEALLISSLLIIGTVAGWAKIRNSFNAEILDTSYAIESSITFPYFSDPLRGTGTTPTFAPFVLAAPTTTERNAGIAAQSAGAAGPNAAGTQ